MRSTLSKQDLEAVQALSAPSATASVSGAPLRSVETASRKLIPPSRMDALRALIALGIDPVLSTAESAAVVGVAATTLRNKRCSGGGPPFVKGPGRRGWVRYRLSELLAWRDQNLRRSTSEVTHGGQ